MKNQEIILTRTFYCPECFKQKRPQAGQKFVSVGSTKHVMEIRRAQHGGTLGFTPHLIYLLDTTRTHAHFAVICGMDECGISIAKEMNDRGRYDIEFLNEGREFTLPLKDWNLLVMLTDLGYRV